jgi:hypothetical protein
MILTRIPGIHFSVSCGANIEKHTLTDYTCDVQQSGTRVSLLIERVRAVYLTMCDNSFPLHSACYGRPGLRQKSAGPHDARVVHEARRRLACVRVGLWRVSPSFCLYVVIESKPLCSVNPPVHAWATFRVFKLERKMHGREDLGFLERVFQKLLINFTWYLCFTGVKGLGLIPNNVTKVGQPEGSRRQQRVRGRLPWHGQYRSI